MSNPLMTSTGALTSAASSPVRCFEVEVAAVRRLSPAFVRITLAGACLDDFDGGGELGPRDQRIKLIFPLPGGTVRAPELESSGWYPRWLALDPAERGEMRTYTVRRTRLGGRRPEIDVDFVLHLPGVAGESSGPGGSWAATASPGDRVSLLGPRRGRCADYRGIEWSPPAPEAGQVLLVGDETAVPAVASILETLPALYVASAVLEVPHADDFAQLSSPASVRTTWLARGSRARGELLRRAVREAVQQAATTDAGTPYVWIAAEAGVVRDLRRHLVTDLGVPRADITFMGYWREGGEL